MSSSTLFVRNKTDDFVGQVFITRENIPNKLIIVDYTRDPKVFSTSASISFSIKCVHPKFTGLTKFLHDRKKAAVVNIQVQSTVETESDIMYILPPDNVTLLSEARCLLNSDISQAAVAQVLTTVIAPTPTPSVPTASPTLPAAAAAAHGSSFLSNLLSKVEADSSRNFVKAPLIKAEVLLAVEQLQSRVRSELHALEEDEARTLVAFEPMEPEQRYLAREVIEEFENLVGISTGEDIERHLVVYKKGSEPAEEVQAAASSSRPAPRKQAKPVARAVAPRPASCIRVSAKRDRRTIEDYQNSKKKKEEGEGEAEGEA